MYTQVIRRVVGVLVLGAALIGGQLVHGAVHGGAQVQGPATGQLMADGGTAIMPPPVQ
jgi:hypothetical protein